MAPTPHQAVRPVSIPLPRGTRGNPRRLSTGCTMSATTARTAATEPRRARRCDVAEAGAPAHPGRHRMTLTEARSRMNPRSVLIWTAVAVVGAVAWGVLALSRGENISAVWLVVAALGSYAIAYRFYARFIVKQVLRVDDSRATPAERLDNGMDFQPDRPPGALRPPLRRHRRRRPAGRAGAGRADGLPARHDLDHHRRDLRRRRAGHGRCCSSRCAATARASARWPARRSARSAASPR